MKRQRSGCPSSVQLERAYWSGDAEVREHASGCERCGAEWAEIAELARAGRELAPPADGLRWGRRVCAAAVRRGVLLRPLGDVVVLMPPLTISSEEIHRIVHVLAAALDEVAA